MDNSSTTSVNEVWQVSHGNRSISAYVSTAYVSQGASQLGAAGRLAMA